MGTRPKHKSKKAAATKDSKTKTPQDPPSAPSSSSALDLERFKHENLTTQLEIIRMQLELEKLQQSRPTPASSSAARAVMSPQVFHNALAASTPRLQHELEDAPFPPSTNSGTRRSSARCSGPAFMSFAPPCLPRVNQMKDAFLSPHVSAFLRAFCVLSISGHQSHLLVVCSFPVAFFEIVSLRRQLSEYHSSYQSFPWRQARVCQRLRRRYHQAGGPEILPHASSLLP